MRIYYILINTVLLCTATYISKAQQGIVSAGETGSATGGRVSNSIGQVTFLNAAAHNGSINQGIQQPYIIQQVSIKEPHNSIGLNVYPNPTTDIIRIETTSDYTNLSYQLTDATGRTLVRSKMQVPKDAVSMQAYATGIYFLNILHNNTLIQTFKITKTN